MAPIPLLEPCAPFPDLLRRRAHATPNLVMLVDEADRELTFVEVLDEATALVDELRGLGVSPGTRVAWQLPTWQESVVLFGALSLLGAVQIPIPHIYRRREVLAGISQTAADLLITPSVWSGFDYAAMARTVVAELALRCFTLDRGRLGSRPLLQPSAEAGSDRTAPPVPLAGPDVRWIFFTSGTSSAPKGVQHTDLSVGLPSLSMAKGLRLQPTDRSAVAFPIGHIGGVNWTIASLLSGCQLLLAERFHPPVIEYFDRRGITLPGVVTAQHLAYRDAARARTDRPLFPHARAYPGGGATKPPTLLAELQQVIGGVIVSGYGMTEHPMITMGSLDDPVDRLARTEGRPSPGVTVSIRDAVTREPVPTGADGEIWLRGPHLFKGYLDPEATAAVMDADGFLRTGDLGRQDELGYVTITGRVKDVIVRKGENISAKEVEDLLYTHPDIVDVAVVGIPDPDVGERCCAVLVLRTGAEPPTVADLGRFLDESGLMKQKWPEQISCVSELARNAAGKVLKANIRAELVRETAGGAAQEAATGGSSFSTAG